MTVLASIYIVNYENHSSHLANILKVFSASQSVISIYIVYLLYDRFGTSKKVLDKRNDLIIEYLEELKKVRIIIRMFNSNGTSTLMSVPISQDLSFIFESPDKDKKIMVRSKEMYGELKRINEIVDHPLFPPSLRKKINVFQFNMLTGALEFKIEDYAFVSYKYEDQFNEEGWMFPNEGEMSLGDYATKLETLVKELQKWINKESSIKIKINFKH